nr:immunoglobulin heavy chain junction region [Macaca mulatta]MOV53935.1 immunoglobulin heavy chain junction region [Macaca mulatta]MOV54125.1 immunoglobulin heavy chain junction region [Macaca mulatta]MOV54226.1 immunoglobulin heavy chain junction region [Macaca mulatta]MOV54234.1 immunoglobulin heavy chain junction region [Macaca mulatta]
CASALYTYGPLDYW